MGSEGKDGGALNFCYPSVRGGGGGYPLKTRSGKKKRFQNSGKIVRKTCKGEGGFLIPCDTV